MKQITVSSDKEKYGVKLKADANFRQLGARLKGDVKAVVAALGELDDSKLTVFQKTGELEVLGHKLNSEEVGLKYAFDTKAKKTHNYEAHSDGEVSITSVLYEIFKHYACFHDVYLASAMHRKTEI